MLGTRRATGMQPDLWTRTVAALVAGSGILNLASLIGRAGATHHPAWARAMFPLEFFGLSHSLTLLSGFTLILAAIHLWPGRRRAWQLSLVLAAASVVFHLTKGWDLEEAFCSAMIAIILWMTRNHFRTGSGRPDLLASLLRAATALIVAGLYGVAGFWLLEPKQFHHNFHWWEAALRTIRLMLFLGDETLIPRTPYAEWFLSSLFWISAAAFLYTGFVLFRPVAYHFRIDWRAHDLARRIAAEHGRTAQDYFKHWPDKSLFFSSTGLSFLGFRVARSYALVLGDPVGPLADRERAIQEFVDHCRRRGWRVGFHQVAQDSLPIYEHLGFHAIRIGDDAIVDLSRFSLDGSAMKEFRNTVNRLERQGYRVERFDPPIPDGLLSELHQVSDGWLQLPGHRERQFTLGRFESWYLQSTTVYAVLDPEGHVVAFANLVPSYTPTLATVDLMRRGNNQVNGAMDFLFVKMFLELKQRGFQRFSLGMAPASEPVTTSGEMINWLLQRIPFGFRTDTLRHFKAKYAHDWSPRYSVYQTHLDLPRLALALKRISEEPRISKRPLAARGMA